ncbi:MAG: oligosaccharide flippase family protein [Bacteroidetes bacterium]|nr:oligosaccharide flippase family protein [Bacteroidota bacterium]
MGLLKSFSIYTFSGVLNRGISFLLLPFFTHHLTQSDYGVIAIFSNSIYFIIPFMSMGVGETLTVEYTNLPKGELKKFISTSLLFPVSVFLAALLLVAIAGHFFSSVTGLSIYLLFLVCLLSLFNFLSEYLFAILRNQNKPVLYAALSIGKTIVELTLAVYFISNLNQGYMGRVNSIIISTAVMVIIAVFYFYKSDLLATKISGEWLNVIFRRGLPSVPFFVMLFVLNNTDNYFINYFHGKGSLGPYALACQVAMIINLVATSFVTPFYPFLYQNLQNKEYLKIGKVLLVYLVLLVAAVMFLTLLSPLLFKIFIAADFSLSLKYIFLLSTGQMCWGIFIIFLGYLYFKKENNKLYYIAAATISFTLCADYFIIKEHYLFNWAWANMLSFLFCLLSIGFLYRRRITGVYRYIMVNRNKLNPISRKNNISRGSK